MGAAQGEAARQLLAGAIQRVGGGDQTALRYVYDQTAAKLFGVCLRILQDKSEAEDVLQEVYVTVWRKAAGFDPGLSSPITWLVTLARNRSIDRLRSLGAHPRHPVSEAENVADAGASAFEQLQTAEENQRLQNCIGELEVRQSGLIREAFMGGLTYQTLAEQSGVPLGTMKSWIRRSLIRLKACLEQ